MNTEKLINDMKGVALECGAIIKEHEHKKMNIETKSSYKDLVTEFDKKIQNYSIKKLSQLYPEASFFSEEKENNIDLKRGLIFVIDPIDGTANFVKGFNYSVISIGCYIDGKGVCAAIFNPFSDELFWAVKGEGAYCNKERIFVREESLANSLVLVGTAPYYTELKEKTFSMIEKVFDKCIDIRRMGAAALDLCQVACGRAGMFFEATLSFWDYAAGAIIVKEAGGLVLDQNGEEIAYDGQRHSIIAGSRNVIEESHLIELKI